MRGHEWAEDRSVKISKLMCGVEMPQLSEVLCFFAGGSVGDGRLQ